MRNKREKWIRWLKIIHDDVTELLVKQNIFWEVQGMIKSNKALHKPSSFYQYLGDTYVAYVCMGIRRQVKINNQSISFAGLLGDIIENPSALSRKYFVSLYDGSTVEDLSDSEFDKFCGNNRDYISSEMVAKDLELLQSASSKIESLADKVIAHRDKKGPTEKPKFNEVDECLKTIDKLYTKYYLIFHAEAMDSLMPVYQYDWTEIFTVPWLEPSDDEVLEI